NEPHRNTETRHGVLLHAHFVQPEAVDDVLARQVHEDRTVDRQVQLIDRRHVVLGIWIRTIETDRIVRADQLRTGAPAPAVRAVVVAVPRELLADHANDNRFVLRREIPYALGPRRDRVEDQQHHLDDDDAYLEPLRQLSLRAGVARLRVGALTESEQHE